jgi:hypothetical protein
MPGSQEFIDQHDSAALASANRNLANVEAAWAQEKQESAGSLNLWNACYANACIALENQNRVQAVESAFGPDLLNLGQATGLRPLAQSFYASSLGYDELAEKYWDQGTFNLGSFIVVSAATEGLGEILAPETLGLARTIDAGTLVSTEESVGSVGLGYLRSAEADLAPSASMGAIPGVPESPFPLPPSFPEGITFKPDLFQITRHIADTSPLTGEISIDTGMWASATPGQQSWLFWHEFSHSERFLAMSPTSRGVNALLYNFSLGTFTEETMAATAASDSIIAGLQWGWNYQGVSKPWVIGQTGLLLGGGAGTGYSIYVGVDYLNSKTTTNK